MKRILLLVVAVVIGFTSCKKDETPGGKTEVTGITTLTAVHEQPSTRISISVEHEGTDVDKLLWCAGDKLYIYELSHTPGEPLKEGVIYNLLPGYSTGENSPIVFDLVSGDGSASAKFDINENEPDGLNPLAHYVAIHAHGNIGGADDIVRYKNITIDGQSFSSLRLGCGGATSNGNGSELCEDRIVLYAPLVFEDGALAPMIFKSTAQTIMEFNITLSDKIASNATLSYIEMTAFDPATSLPVKVFAKSMDISFNNSEGLNLDLASSEESVSATHRFTSTGNLLLKSSESTRIRFPIIWDRGLQDAFGSKKIEVKIGMKIDGEDMTYTKAFDRTVLDASNPAFLPGVTYPKPMTVTSLNGNLPRGNWNVVDFSTLYADAATGDKPLHLFDGITTTYLALVKPGKKIGTVPIQPLDMIPFFTVDLGDVPQEYNYFNFRNRTGHAIVGLRVNAISLSGSNDNITFEPMGPQITLNVANTDMQKLQLDKAYTYRYIKVVVEKFHATEGSTMQISEFGLGLD